MAQIELERLFAFIAFGATGRAGQNDARPALPCRIAAGLALGSLASVALSSIPAAGVYQTIHPSRRGHLYFA